MNIKVTSFEIHLFSWKLIEFANPSQKNNLVSQVPVYYETKTFVINAAFKKITEVFPTYVYTIMKFFI